MCASYMHTPTCVYIQDLVVGKGHRVQLKEAEGYASTYYHIPKTVVQKVSTPELNKVRVHPNTIMHACESYV